LAGKSWGDDEAAICRMLTEQGASSREVSRELRERGFHRIPSAVRNKNYEEGWHPSIPDSPVPLGQPPPRIEGNALLLFDIHSPCHDKDWLDRVISLAMKWGITNVGIGGDLVDFDAFSTFQRSGDFDADTEIVVTEKILQTLEGCFDEVLYSNGNHEMRLPRQTGWMLPVESAVKMFLHSGKTTFSSAFWFEVESGGQKFLAEHPKNASQIPVTVARDMCSVYLRNIIAGHGHDWGMVLDRSGTFWGIASGIGGSPLRMAYITRRHGRRPLPQQGAVIIRDGCTYLLGSLNIAGYERMRFAGG
jgi:hypothetical protein